MRQPLLAANTPRHSYEIREIVKKAEALESLGYRVYYENIGDPIQKNGKVAPWIKEIIARLLLEEDRSYGYSHSKGLRETREFLANRCNQDGGCQIGPDDITFFNGLGDAVSKVYQFLPPSTRVILPSPSYSAHATSEKAHSGSQAITYDLDPENGWQIDLKALRLKIENNPHVAGILVINPDNPTGAVFSETALRGIVALAKEYGMFLIFDEVYENIHYNGAEVFALRKIIGKVPGIALKGISKELPWPGSRCGWTEYYNRSEDDEFRRLCEVVDQAKMVEVSSTTLPQRAIPAIFSDPRHKDLLREHNSIFERRSHLMEQRLSDIPYITFNKPRGAFYCSILFKENALKAGQKLKIQDPKVGKLLSDWVQPGAPLDKCFAYHLLAAKHVCVVPLSSFCSTLMGFRITLLEEDEKVQRETYDRLREGIFEFCSSA